MYKSICKYRFITSIKYITGIMFTYRQFYFKNSMSMSGVMHVERSSYKFRPYRGVTAAGRFFCIQHFMVPKPLFYIYSDSADHRKSTKFESIKSKWLAQQFAGSFNHITGLLKYNLTQIGISNPIYIQVECTERVRLKCTQRPN